MIRSYRRWRTRRYMRQFGLEHLLYENEYGALRIKEPNDLSDEEYLERYGEPRGAGADPAGRPDPRTHPEFWTE